MSLFSQIAYAILFLMMVTVGLLVLFKDYRSPTNRTFFLFTVSILLWAFTMFSGYASVPDDLPSAVLYFRYAYGISAFPLFFLALFFYYFPTKTFSMKKWFYTTLIVLCSAFFIVGAFTPYLEEGAYMQDGVEMDVLGPLYTPYLVFCLFLMILAVKFVWKKFKTVQGVDKSKLMIVSLGFIMFAFLATLTNAILPIFNIFIFQAESVTFSAFFFLAVFYAIYKQRFFNLSYLFLQLLREIILIVFALLVLIVSYELLQFVTTERYVMAVGASLVAFICYRLINNFVPLFYSQRFSHLRNALQELNGKLFHSKTYENLNDLLENTFIEKLSFWNCHLYMITKKDIPDGIPLYLEDSLTSYLRRHKAIVMDEIKAGDVSNKKTADLIMKMHTLQAAVCFGLFFENTLIGLFSVGSKLNRQMVSSEELKEMSRVMKDVGICFMNIIVNENLREENDLMKNIISVKTNILRKNNEKLQTMIKQQDSFISLTAHEFRTPLAVAMLGMEQIPKVHKDIPNEVVQDVQTSYRQLNRLTALINRLLEMRRVDDNKVPVIREKFEVVSFVKMLVKNMQLLAVKDGVRLEFEHADLKRLPVNTDQMKIQEILENLMGNALKFSKKGDVIRLAMSYDKKKKMVSVSVTDQGPGVPKKDFKIIFEKFRQGSRYSRGVGIGLYLCKQYLRLLKGDITLTSVDGVGATFTITFPIE